MAEGCVCVCVCVCVCGGRVIIIHFWQVERSSLWWTDNKTLCGLGEGRRIWGMVKLMLTEVYRQHRFSSVQSLSCVWLFVIPWTIAHQASLSIASSRSLLKLMSIESVMPSNHLILSCPLLLLPSIFPSIRVFFIESVLHIRWPKYWSFSFSVSPSNEYLRLISFRMDWLDLLVVQDTLKSLLQHHSTKTSILWHSAFFIVQLSQPIHDHWKNHSFD